jgi:esterase/lipase superfamily enzyme
MRCAGRLGSALLGLALLAACQGPTLPAAPNLYSGESAGALVDIPPERRTTEVTIYYGTDREPKEESRDGQLSYSYRRSPNLAFGRVTVTFGDDLTWEELMDASLGPHPRKVPLRITEVTEMLQYPSSISPLIYADGEWVEDPEVLAARADADERVREAINAHLATLDRKEIFIYVHGVGNGFEDPFYRMAQLWHFLGRPGMPVVYTWPSRKGGGVLRSYTYARESSEFTVYHFREFLWLLASCEEVDRIHILAHSRGTDVTVSVLRDIQMYCRGAGISARERFKLGNVILAAPDLDWEVTQQRTRPDRVALVPERLTLYVSPEDKAIGIADWLFGSIRRLGQMTADMLSKEQLETLKSENYYVDVINVHTSKLGAFGHTYFIDSPAVLSDVILILRDNRDAGAEHGRPLLKREDGFMEIRDGYPFAGDHAAASEMPTPDPD